jgi:hypothetical protein
MKPMSSRTHTTPPPVSRPCFFDYLFLLAGVGLSLYLMRLAPIRAAPDESRDRYVAAVIEFLPALMRIPEGVILLWPIFFATQWPGRSRGLILGEWLWLLAWVCMVLITGLTAWETLIGLPTWLQPHATKPRLLWYALFAPAIALLALVFLIVSLLRPPAPWTQNLGLALLIWPAGPSLAVLILGRFVAP